MSTVQTCYVEVRNIIDANIFIQDAIGYTDREHEEEPVLFLNQMCVEINIYEKLWFGPRYRQRINSLFKSANAAIVTNGFMSSDFPISRSIKQGCPFAPIL